MIEKIAMWGGIAGIIIAIFAIIILYLTRSNIIDLLDRDVVMYDKNYEIKKSALFEAFNCLDVVAKNGDDIKYNAQFNARAKEAYNGLLCVVNSPKLYQEFYRIAIDTNAPSYSVFEIEKFKIACRAELVTKRKGNGEGFKGSQEHTSLTQLNQMVQSNQIKRPVQSVPPQQASQANTTQRAPRQKIPNQPPKE